MNDTQREIIRICEYIGGSGWLSTNYFTLRIKKTDDIIAKNLKILFDDGTLEREAAGKPWRYYYHLKRSGREISINEKKGSRR